MTIRGSNPGREREFFCSQKKAQARSRTHPALCSIGNEVISGDEAALALSSPVSAGIRMSGDMSPSLYLHGVDRSNFIAFAVCRNCRNTV